MANNIILIGFSFTGKTKVAQFVARMLGWNWQDSDDEIINLAGKSIPEIFSQDGEPAFRRLEKKALKKLCSGQNQVIATGGGAILDEGNRSLFQKSGFIVCLEARPETIYKRLKLELKQNPANPVIRPLLSSSRPLWRINELKAYRQPYYSIAGWTVHTDKLCLEEVAQEVVHGYRYSTRPEGLSLNLRGKKIQPVCHVVASTGTYPIFTAWGLLDCLDEALHSLGISGKVVIISDNHVLSLLISRIKDCLSHRASNLIIYEFPAGEKSKSLKRAQSIYDYLVQSRVERKDCILALGGGVTTDLAGFVAATYLRGIALVHLPTSIIAMSDAAIGGKAAVNLAEGKNLVGAFYQPASVFMDTETLTTLPQRERRVGWAEVLKHAFILDPALLDYLEANVSRLKSLEPRSTTRAIAWSSSLKAGVVSLDEKETGLRRILNFGHTIAHGLEAALRYRHLLHGETVAVGMLGAALLSQRLGFIGNDTVKRMRRILESFELPTSLKKVSREKVTEAMMVDKKVRDKAIHWVLLKGIGETTMVKDIPQKDVVEVLRELGCM